MVLNTKIKKLAEYFNVQKPEDWTKVLPSSVLAVHDVGEATLNLLRLHLAARGLTLRDDQTPAFWQSHLSEVKIGTNSISQTDIATTCPFRILIDSREQHPFAFAGMMADASQGGAPMLVQTEVVSLGNSMGDYAIDGFIHECHVERKSLQDAHGTILGWGDRREQFCETLKSLAELPSSAVVVECTLGELLLRAPSRGKKSAGENAKILHRQVMAWMDDYRVPWVFCDNRRLAEITTFRWLYRYWRHRREEQKRAEKACGLDQSELDAVLGIGS